jgi:TP901 family phage tail tape measure protein
LPDSLQLGMGIQFNFATLNQLNSMVSFVQKLQKKFDEMGDPIKKTKQTTVDLNAELQKINTNMMKTVKTVENTGKSITQTFEKSKNQLIQVTKSADGTVTSLKTIHKTTDNIATSIGNAVNKMLLWSSAGFLLFNSFRTLQTGFSDMVKMETEAINIAKVLPEGVKVQPFEERSIELAKRYGDSVIKVEQATANWAKQYKNVNDVAIATNASILAATATDITFEGSVKDLSSILAEWNLRALDSIHIVNILNEVSNNYRVTAQDVADALAKTGSGAKALGLSVEELTGIVTTGIQTLGMAGTEVGTMFTRVMARIRGNKSAREAIQSLGIDAMLPLNDILDQLMIKWDQMTSGEKQNFAITVSGTQHWSRFTGIMDNYNTVLEATAKSYFSAGSAQKEVDNVMKSLAKKVEQLNATWQEYIHTNNGVLGVSKLFVDTLRNIISGLNLVPSAVTGTIIALVALITTTLALKAAAIAAGKSIGVMLGGFFTGPIGWAIIGITSLATVLGVVGAVANKTANQIANIELQVQKLNQEIEGNSNTVRGIENLSKKYQLLESAIQQAKLRNEDYGKLQEKIDTIVGELAKTYNKTTEEMQAWINKDGGMKAFAKNREDELLTQINLQQRLRWEQEKTVATMQGATGLTSFLKTPEQIQEAFKAVYNFQNLVPVGVISDTAKKAIEKSKNLISGEDFFAELALRYRNIQKFQNAPTPLTLSQVLNSGTGGGGQGLFSEDLKTTAQVMEEYRSKLEEIVRLSSANISGYDGLNAKIELQRSTMDDLTKTSDFSQTKLNELASEYNYNLQVQQQVNAENEALLNTTKELTKAEVELIEKNKQYMMSVVSGARNAIESWNNRGVNPLRLQARDARNLASLPSTSFGDAWDLKVLADQLERIANMQDGLTMLKTLPDLLSKLDEGLGQFSNTLVSLVDDIVNKNLVGIIAKILGGIIDYFKQFDQYKLYSDKIKNLNFDRSQNINTNPTADILNNYNNFDTIKAGYNTKAADLLNQMNGLMDWNIFGINNKKIEEVQKQLDDLFKQAEDKLGNILGQLTQALGVSINDIVSSLENAFQATDYFGFLQNWGANLESMTRQALVKAFLGQSSFQGPMTDLGNKIALFVADGVLSAGEVSAIKIAGIGIAGQMQALYQSLSLVDNMFAGNNAQSQSQSSGSYIAGSSQTVTYNIYCTVEAGIFWGDENQAREAAIEIGNLIAEETGRA